MLNPGTITLISVILDGNIRTQGLPFLQIQATARRLTRSAIIAGIDYIGHYTAGVPGNQLDAPAGLVSKTRRLGVSGGPAANRR